MKVFKMPCNQLPIYCVHQSTPVKYVQRFSHCPILDEKRPNDKLEKEVEAEAVEADVTSTNSESFINRPVESERVKEIQNKIVNLRECNNLLISHIRKLFDDAYRPTREDLDYLQQLYDADQKNVQELGESLISVKLPLDSSSSSSSSSSELSNGLNQTFPINNCANPCIRQWEECDYSAIKAPSPLPTAACIRKHASFNLHCCQLQQQQQQRRFLQRQSHSFRETSGNHEGKCCRRVLGECEHNKDANSNGELFRMEMELKEIKKRVDKLTDPQFQSQNGNPNKRSDWSIISAAEEDKSMLNTLTDDVVDKKPAAICKNSSKCKRKGKCSCGTNGTLKRKFKCIIT